MACNKPKEMRFRIYEYDLPKTVGKGGTIHQSNEDSEYHDSGKEFTISEDDAKATLKEIGYYDDNMPEELFSTTTIPRVMMRKMFGFVSGWPMQWTAGKENCEGYIGSHTYRAWYIKRVL